MQGFRGGQRGQVREKETAKDERASEKGRERESQGESDRGKAKKGMSSRETWYSTSMFPQVRRLVVTRSAYALALVHRFSFQQSRIAMLGHTCVHASSSTWSRPQLRLQFSCVSGGVIVLRSSERDATLSVGQRIATRPCTFPDALALELSQTISSFLISD